MGSRNKGDLAARKLLAVGALVLAVGCLSPLARATVGDRKDVAAPNPVTALADRDRRLAEKGMIAGSPIMIRIFKSESELELWMSTGERYELFATYRICNWSGALGPKQHEGDRQAPEGLYTVGPVQIHRKGRWPRSMNIGYPNSLDRAYGRTGSLILVHGGCTSTGCYAMTNPVMEEIYGLAEQALSNGQTAIPVHVFPFRMTPANLEAYGAAHRWHDFWLNLKEAYDAFEQTHVPPSVDVCEKKYVIRHSGEEGTANLGADCRPLEIFPLASEEVGRAHRRARHAHKVASKAHRRVSAGRNTRKAYAAARRARMAAKGMRTSSVSSGKRAR